MGLSLLIQVLIVRTLSKDDFGSFAYALAIAALVQSFLALGLDRSDTVFLTRFDEAGDTGRLRGLLVLELSAVATSGLVALGVLALLAGRVIGGVPPSVLLLLAATAPLMAADTLVLNAFAVFASPRAIFLRRYVLDPLLRLAVVGVLILTGMRLLPLAIGYLLAAGVGTAIYLALLVRLVRRVTARHPTGTRLRWPGVEVFRFAAPLLLAALMYAATMTVPTLVLKSFGSTAAVAELRAVQPVAALILVVPTVFATLFLPRAARLATRAEGEPLRQHYWATALWVGVLAFPAVLMFAAFSATVTTLLFGARYADAARPLAIMAVAFYANAALGLNGSLLQVTGRLRQLTVANVAGLVTACLGSALLIPAWGAEGAAWAVAAALVVPQLLKQLALRATPVGSTHPAAVRLWLTTGSLLVLALVVSTSVSRSLPAALITTAVGGVLVVAVMARDLIASEVLPRRRRRPTPPQVAPAEHAGHAEDGADLGLGATELPGTWQCLDWRFFAPDPALGAVWVAGVAPAVPRALVALGAHLLPSSPADPRGSPAADTVVIAGSRCTETELAAVRARLRPGGRLVVEVRCPPPASPPGLSLRRWTAWRRRLPRAGFVVDGVYVALPNLERTSALVALDERVALTAALRRQPVRLAKRAAAAVAGVAIRFGLREVVCRQGVIIAHLAAEDQAGPG